MNRCTKREQTTIDKYKKIDLQPLSKHILIIQDLVGKKRNMFPVLVVNMPFFGIFVAGTSGATTGGVGSVKHRGPKTAGAPRPRPK